MKSKFITHCIIHQHVIYSTMSISHEFGFHANPPMQIINYLLKSHIIFTTNESTCTVN